MSDETNIQAWRAGWKAAADFIANDINNMLHMVPRDVAQTMRQIKKSVEETGRTAPTKR